MQILLINPWIEDFSAFDLWMRPLNLLRIASVLQANGCEVKLIDCLDRNLDEKPNLKKHKLIKYGCGHYNFQVIDKPTVFHDIPRLFKRFGMSEEILTRKLNEYKPDLIVVSCQMTYWYTGANAIISKCKEIYSKVPVWLGGIYPILCPGHAKKNSLADFVFTGGFTDLFIKLVKTFPVANITYTGEQYVSPVYSLMGSKKVIPLLTSIGCPNRCNYCASSKIYPSQVLFPIDRLFKDLEYCIETYGSSDFVFYDDALLSNAQFHIKVLLKRIIDANLKVRFHTPNALHARLIDKELAHLMQTAGFKTIRLGLEFSDENQLMKTGNKVKREEYSRAIKFLLEAGFHSHELVSYIMYGYPGVSISNLEDTVAFVNNNGSSVNLAYYSPIPGTKALKNSLNKFTPSLNEEPLLSNNSITPYRMKDIPFSKFQNFKKKVELVNKSLSLR